MIRQKEAAMIEAALLNQAFGKGCGDVYLKSKKDEHYDEKEVIRSGVDPHKEISYQYDIGSYTDSDYLENNMR